MANKTKLKEAFDALNRAEGDVSKAKASVSTRIAARTWASAIRHRYNIIEGLASFERHKARMSKLA